MTRQQAIAAAPQTTTAYWINIAFCVAAGTLFAFILARGRNIWVLYLLLLLLTLTLLQSAERLAFPVRTALRSRALNIKFGRRISTISGHLAQVLFVAAICALVYHLATSHGSAPTIANSLITSGFLLTLLTHDLLGHKFQDPEDFEHSPPLTDLKPLQSENWGTPHTS